MNPRTTALLALTAVLLGGFIYFNEIVGESARQAALDDEKRIHPGLDAEALEAIELTSEEGVEARFERVEGRWRVVSPVAAPADATALDAIAHALTILPREGSVANPGPLDHFGLGKDARSVRFEIAGEVKGLRIGGATPVGGHTYVARLADDDVSYVESYRMNAFKRKFDDLRDRRVFDFDAGDVRTLRVSWPAVDGSTEVALARDASGQWQMGVPTTGRGDQQTLRELLSDLSFLRAKGFVDERTKAVDVALADAEITFHWTQGGDHVERSARIGGLFQGGRLVETPSGRLVTIDVERMDDFARTVNAYRFKMLSEFDVDRAGRLIIEFADEGEGSRRVEAELGDAGWSGGDPPIDPDRVSALVRDLSSLRAADIVADEMGPNELASLGLSPPRVRIRIEDRAKSVDETQVVAEIAIGRLDEERGLFAQRIGDGEGDAAVFALPLAAAEKLPSSWNAFASGFVVQQEPEDASAEPDADVLDSDPLEGVEIP